MLTRGLTYLSLYRQSLNIPQTADMVQHNCAVLPTGVMDHLIVQKES
jgi:hypothetical protein